MNHLKSSTHNITFTIIADSLDEADDLFFKLEREFLKDNIKLSKKEHLSNGSGQNKHNTIFVTQVSAVWTYDYLSEKIL